jgi:hypothetical protein
MSHTVDWRERGSVAVVQWCSGEFLDIEIWLKDGESAICSSCRGTLTNKAREVVCRALDDKPAAAPETVRTMFKRILAEED